MSINNVNPMKKPTFSENSIDDKTISLITEQIRDLRAEYVSIQSSFLTMTALSFGGYGLILYYACKLDVDSAPVNYVFLAFPFLFGISFINILKYTIKMLGLGAYLAQLEKIINSSERKNIFAWHSKLIYANGYNYVGVAHIPCNLALYLIIGYKFYQNMEILKSINDTMHTAIFILIIIMFAIILFSLVVCATQYGEIKYWSKENFESYFASDLYTRRPHWLPKLFQKKSKK